MDPGTGAAVAAGINAVGGALSGNQAAKLNKKQTALEQLLGQRGLDIQSASVADQIRRQFETMPTRDRVLAQLQARMGQSPGQFNPSGLFSNAAAPAQQGGVNMGALQNAAANYQPGSGGTRPDLAASMLGKLGYTPQGGGTGNDWQQAMSQKFKTGPSWDWANAYVRDNGTTAFPTQLDQDYPGHIRGPKNTPFSILQGLKKPGQ